MPPEFLLVLFPNLWGAILAPPHRPTSDPYDGLWVDGTPTRYEDGSVGAPWIDERRVRHLELTTSGFVADNTAVFSRTLGARVFLGQVVASASWDRMYETPGDGTLARLDFWRFHLTSNFLGGSSRALEVYPLLGFAWMQGNRGTGAFDAGLDLRLYPLRPFMFAMSSVASVFRYGPVLFDSRFEAGLTFDRVELRAGLRWMYQHDAQGFLGPMASLTVRL